MAVYIGTPNPDTFGSYESVDQVDGLGGYDRWDGTFQTFGDIAFTYDGRTGAGSVSNGTTIANIEAGSILTGDGNDTFTLVAAGFDFEVFGMGGYDTLIRDDSTTTADAFLNIGLSRFDASSFEGQFGASIYRFIEHLDFRLGTGNDVVQIDLNPLNYGGTVRMDGGSGMDSARIDALPIGDAVFIADANGNVTGNLGTWSNFEAFEITLSGQINTIATWIGNDTILSHPTSVDTSVSAGDGDDTVISQGGTNHFDGGDGSDTFVISGASSAFTITPDGAGGFVVVENSTEEGIPPETGYLVNVERVQFDDTVVILPATPPGGSQVGTAGDDVLVGDDGDNAIEGLAGADRLRGLGGADLLDGGEDDDTLRGNGGSDTLLGGAGADLLYGGAGSDVLAGGWGKDELTGGGGADTFRFDVFEKALNRDLVTDFEHGIDHIEIARSAFEAFAGAGPGALDPASFIAGPVARTADHHLVYNKITGELFYDADGAGGAAHVKIATLSGKPVLDAGDILLI